MTGLDAIAAYIAAAALLIGAFLWLAYRRPKIAVGLFLLTLLLSAGALSRSLGYAMPVSWEISGPDSFILAAPPMLDEGRAIYLVVTTESGPKLYALPWSLDDARRLHEAQQEAAEGGTGLQVEGLFDGSDGELMVHALPPEALPPKTEGGS